MYAKECIAFTFMTFLCFFLARSIRAVESKTPGTASESLPAWEAPAAPPFWSLIGKNKNENHQQLSQEQFDRIVRIAYEFHQITEAVQARGRRSSRTDEEYQKQLELLEKAFQVLTPEQRAKFEADKMAERMRRRLFMLVMEKSQEEQLHQLAQAEVSGLVKLPVTQWEARQHYEIEVVKKAIERILNEQQKKIIAANAEVYQYVMRYKLTEGFKCNF